MFNLTSTYNLGIFTFGIVTKKKCCIHYFGLSFKDLLTLPPNLTIQNQRNINNNPSIIDSAHSVYTAILAVIVEHVSSW